MSTEDLARELDRRASEAASISPMPRLWSADDQQLIRAAAARLRGLQALANDAAEEIESWGAYAGEHFQTKHDLAGTVARFRRAAQLTERSDEP